MKSLDTLINDGFTIFYTVYGDPNELRLAVHCINVKEYRFYIPHSFFRRCINEIECESIESDGEYFHVTFRNKKQFLKWEYNLIEMIDL